MNNLFNRVDTPNTAYGDSPYTLQVLYCLYVLKPMLITYVDTRDWPNNRRQLFVNFRTFNLYHKSHALRVGRKKCNSCGHAHNFLTPTPARTAKTVFCGNRQKLCAYFNNLNDFEGNSK